MDNRCRLIFITLKQCPHCIKVEQWKPDLIKRLDGLVTVARFEKDRNEDKEFPDNILKFNAAPTILLCSPKQYQKLLNGEQFDPVIYAGTMDEKGMFQSLAKVNSFTLDAVYEWTLLNISNAYRIDVQNGNPV